MKKVRILTIDGGGVRGVASATWLDKIQASIDRPLHEVFDIVVGVSTGAILATLITSNALGGGSYANAYMFHALDVFPKGWRRFWSYVKRIPTQGLSAPKYDHIPLELALHRQFKHTRLGDLSTRTLIVGYDTLARSAVVLKSNDPRYAGIQVVDAVRGSTAAPTYFSAHRLMTDYGRLMSIIDGGVVANNPVLCGVADALNMGYNLDEVEVISLGVNELPHSMPYADVRQWGLTQWAVQDMKRSPLINVMMDGPNDANNYIARRLLGENYIRLSMTSDVAMDDSANETLQRLNRSAQDWIVEDPHAGRTMDTIIQSLRET